MDQPNCQSGKILIWLTPNSDPSSVFARNHLTIFSMKKLRNLLVITALVSVLTGLTGCGLTSKEPAKPAQDVVKESITNLLNTTSKSYDLTVNGDAVGAPGATPKDVKFNGTVAGVYDGTEAKKPQFTVKLDGSLIADAAPENSLSLEMRLDKANLYLNVAKIPDLGTTVPKETIAMIVGKWWKIAVPEGTFDQLAAINDQNDKDLSPDAKAMKDLFKNTNFFTGLKFVGSENVNGANAFHYTGTLDKVAVKTFVTEASKLQKQTLADTDVKNLDAFLAATTAPVDFWVDETTMTLTKVTSQLNVVPQNAGSLKIDLGLTFGNFNQAVTIEVPKDATLFDPSKFLGGSAATTDAATSATPATTTTPAATTPTTPATKQ